MHRRACATLTAISALFVAGAAAAQPVAPEPSRSVGAAATASLDLEGRMTIAVEPELHLGTRAMLRARIERGRHDDATVTGGGLGIGIRVGELGSTIVGLMFVTEEVIADGADRGWNGYGIAPGFARAFELSDNLEMRLGAEIALELAGNAEVAGFLSSYRGTASLAGWF